ncbi:MAG TPA: hypothetical protein VHD90_21120 [Phototrophicaceae bacterium]|nr:hypothetical protein [Phototrophicaceae bacterium]
MMPIHVSWGNPDKTYTVFTFEGKWTWEEYYRAVAQAFEMVKDCNYTVNILIDMLNCNLFPQNLLSHLGASMQHAPRPFDLAVVVTSSRFIEMIASTIEKLYGKRQTRFKVTKTLDEAHALLKRAALNPQSPSSP